MRADPGRNRVFVLDAANSQVSVWTPEGSLIFAAGRRGEGPGEFAAPQDISVETEDGTFSVLEGNGSRFSYFTAYGKLMETRQGPGMQVSYQGFPLALTFPRKRHPPGSGQRSRARRSGNGERSLL